MIKIPEEISIYLPRYLSDTSKNILIKELSKFPTDGTKDVVYTSALKQVDYLLQGDGIDNVPYISFPNTDVGDIPAILLSNTCDMSTDNERLNPCRIMYAPIVRLEKYKSILCEKGIENKRVEQHIKDIKLQHITQILYLPKGNAGIGLSYEGIVFFDRAISIPLDEKTNRKFVSNKLFTLSDFGFYLFLLKLSYHLSRVQERIDRKEGKDISISTTN